MSQRLNLELPNYFLMYSKIEQRKTLQSNQASAHSSVQLHPWQRIFGAVKSFLFFWTRCSPSGEQQFWEFHVTSTGTLLGVCSRSALQNMWMKGMRFKAPPSPFLFGGGPGGCEWSLTDGKQAVWPINLSLLWLRELSVWVWRKRRVEGGKSWCSGWTSWITAYHDFWEETDGSYGTETVFMLKRVWIHAQCPSDLSEKLCYKKSFV